jgi:hypothetical protein
MARRKSQPESKPPLEAEVAAAEVADAPAPPEVGAPDDTGPESSAHAAFWADDALSTEENAEALASLLEGEDHDADEVARATRSYMGTAIDHDERDRLVAWAESKACRTCRRRLARAHDLDRLPHEECRNALRAARVLARDG